LAHEDSPAGDYYNDSALVYIKHVISTSPYSQEFDLVEAFHNHINEKVKNYLSTELVTNQSIILEKENNEVPAGLRLNLPEKYTLKLSSANEFGQIQTYDRGGLEKVPYTVKVYEKETQKYLQLEFEIVGKCHFGDIKYKVYEIESIHMRIEVKGKSYENLLWDENFDEKCVRENTRKFGDFTILTEKIDVTGFTIFRGEKPKFEESVGGLKTLTWKLYPEADTL